MKSPRNLGQILTLALAVSPLATAFPWPRWLPEVDALIARQDDSSSSSAVPTLTETSATQTSSGSSKAAPTTTNLNTGGQSKTASGTASSGTGTRSGSATSSGSTHTTFNAQDPAGGISMITPAATLGEQLYRIGETVTFAWNYTSLQATPNAINVLASCSTASASWTISANMSFDATQTVTWDTGAYQQTAVASPLLTEEYTLIIYDADSSVSATAEAGYLATYEQYVFGLYSSRPYSDLGEWKCATCSAAASLDSKALGMAIGMCLVTVLSFTWFVTGALL